MLISTRKFFKDNNIARARRARAISSLCKIYIVHLIERILYLKREQIKEPGRTERFQRLRDLFCCKWLSLSLYFCPLKNGRQLNLPEESWFVSPQEKKKLTRRKLHRGYHALKQWGMPEVADTARELFFSFNTNLHRHPNHCRPEASTCKAAVT